MPASPQKSYRDRVSLPNKPWGSRALQLGSPEGQRCCQLCSLQGSRGWAEGPDEYSSALLCALQMRNTVASYHGKCVSLLEPCSVTLARLEGHPCTQGAVCALLLAAPLPSPPPPAAWPAEQAALRCAQPPHPALLGFGCGAGQITDLN